MQLAAFAILKRPGFPPVRDLDGDRLTVGREKAKNDYRRRELVLPPSLARWLAELVRARESDEPLFRRADGKRMIAESVAWELRSTGHTPQVLRRCFRTHSRNELGLNEGLVRAYMGRTPEGLSDVDRKHYQARAEWAQQREILKPAADAWEIVLVE